ncbi:unnamed protein product [Coregonus sp. 'balchen']|nr:unnamed protein product [Coregonus sp. 'balchen']
MNERRRKSYIFLSFPYRMMSSKQVTPPFPPATEEEDAMGEDNVGWANEDRESQDQPSMPALHGKPLPEEYQPIRDSQPESVWERIGSTQTDNSSSKGCSLYSYRNNSPPKPEECSRERGEQLGGSAFGTPERRKGSLADVVDTLKQKKLVELTKTEQDGRRRPIPPVCVRVCARLYMDMFNYT